ncbi:MAG TPA: MerR family transcriptional regulator [Solirubrobacteraceae bacterium]|nr:MerR family transcriptional regulator [Solirubrobacteraceae bacterium]
MALDTTTAELTIDELARETGMTVRNIRSHASRGLLQPPAVRARTGYYGPEHVARLRLIQELQANGYNLAAIKHLLQRGDGEAERVLGFARSLLAPFEVERPEVVDAAELAAKWGAAEVDPKLVARAEKLGLVVPLGDGRYEILSPTVLRAGEVVRELGVSPERAMDIVDRVVRSADSVTKEFVRLFMEQVWKPFREADGDLGEVQEAVERLRPLATETLVAVFHLRMTQAVEQAFSRELERRAKR